ncbi:MAG: uracil-DNA glycosylase [Thermotogae bacterium]|nr:MAG: uracil-DNA glycosylase [Thermotogota bacterium]
MGGGNIRSKEDLMNEIIDRIASCAACPLSVSRSNVVPGEGSLDTPIMFVGEGPGEEEDLSGRPFVGRAGRLLDKIFESVQLNREEFYITNVVKCRPPGNRTPKQEERRACSHFLYAQIALIQPKLIVCLGATALSFFLETPVTMREARGKFYPWIGGIRLFVMYHPSYLLRVQSKAPGSPKYQTWEDIKLLKKVYEKLIAGWTFEQIEKEIGSGTP